MKFFNCVWTFIYIASETVLILTYPLLENTWGLLLINEHLRKNIFTFNGVKYTERKKQTSPTFHLSFFSNAGSILDEVLSNNRIQHLIKYMSIRSKFENGGKRSSYGFHTHRNVVFLPRKKRQMKSKEWGNRIKKNVYFTSTAR